MSRRALTLAALAVTCLPAQAAIIVSSTAFTYNQDFNSLTTSVSSSAWGNDLTLAGWSLFNSTGAAITTYIADNGSNIVGGFKSFGPAGNVDRALGGLGSNGTYFGSPANGAVAGWIAAAFTNSTGNALSGFTIGFNGEQWRNGGNMTPQPMVLEYGFGSTFGTVSAWTAPGGNFDWTSPVATIAAGAVDGNIAGKVAGRGGSVAADWAADSTLWVRWIERNDVSFDHALAIDNLTLSVSGTSVPVPGSLVLLLGGLTSLGFAGRRAVRRV